MSARIPYVGEGAEGCRRSAAIDRSEADMFDRDDPRRDERLASAERWEQQAEQQAALTSLLALAAYWECEPPGQHPDQWRHREGCPGCSHADALRAEVERG